VTGRAAKTFRSNFNDHRPAKNRHMAQTQLPSITMKLAGFVTTLCADRPLSRALDCDDDLPLAQFVIEDADFGQIQGNFNLRWHRFNPPLWFGEGRSVPYFIRG